MVRAEREARGSMVVVRLKNESDRREVTKRKKALKGDSIWIADDLMWKERQTKWRINEIAREEKRKGAKVWVGYNRISIEGQRGKEEKKGKIKKAGEGERGYRRRNMGKGEGG